MIKIRASQFFENGVYKIRFYNDFTAPPTDELKLFTKFGEPLINVGGTFLLGEPEEFTFPDRFIKVYTGLPYQREVDPTVAPFNVDAAQTELQLNEYRDVIIDRITTAYTELRTKGDDDTYSRDNVYTI